MGNTLITIEDYKKTLIKDLNKSFKVVNDIDIEEYVNSFCDKGWVDIKKSYEENLKSCIQYIAIKKAKKR